MPELPEVETVRRQLEPVLAGRRIGLLDIVAHTSSEEIIAIRGAAGALYCRGVTRRNVRLMRSPVTRGSFGTR